MKSLIKRLNENKVVDTSTLKSIFGRSYSILVSVFSDLDAAADPYFEQVDCI